VGATLRAHQGPPGPTCPRPTEDEVKGPHKAEPPKTRKDPVINLPRLETMAFYSITAEKDLSACIDLEVKELLQVTPRIPNFETELRIIREHNEIRAFQEKAEADADAKIKKQLDESERIKREAESKLKVAPESIALISNPAGAEQTSGIISGFGLDVRQSQNLSEMESPASERLVKPPPTSTTDALAAGHSGTILASEGPRAVNAQGNIPQSREIEASPVSGQSGPALERYISQGEREALAAVEALQQNDQKVTAMCVETKCKRDECIFYLESTDYDLSKAIALYKSLILD
jgi:hypothetical protein